MIEKLALVAVGGAAGAVLRFLSVNAAGRWFGETAWGTALVNVLGSFVMGLIAMAIVYRLGDAAPRASALVLTGLLGGFTTFSAFSLDAFRLWETGRAGMAALYVGGSVTLSLAAVIAGVFAGRSLFG